MKKYKNIIVGLLVCFSVQHAFSGPPGGVREPGMCNNQKRVSIPKPERLELAGSGPTGTCCYYYYPAHDDFDCVTETGTNCDPFPEDKWGSIWSVPGPLLGDCKSGDEVMAYVTANPNSRPTGITSPTYQTYQRPKVINWKAGEYEGPCGGA